MLHQFSYVHDTDILFLQEVTNPEIPVCVGYKASAIVFRDAEQQRGLARYTGSIFIQVNDVSYESTDCYSVVVTINTISQACRFNNESWSLFAVCQFPDKR
jgi:hypothetical protein